MTLLATALDMRTLQQESAVARALRSPHIHLFVAVLAEYFTGTSHRQPADDLHISLTEELRDIWNAEDFDPKYSSAAELCSTLVAMRLLALRQESSTGNEFYEITSTGQQVLDHMQSLENRHSTVTQSRLALVTHQISQLEKLTNPNIADRLDSLHREREAIDEHIERLTRGDIEVQDPERALEQLREVVALARQVPRDFARVREAIAGLAADIRLRLLDLDIPQGETLAAVFSHLNDLNEDAAGKSFSAFHALLIDVGSQEIFYNAIRKLDERGILDDLPDEDRQLLRGYLRLLKEEARPIRSMMSDFSRNLQEFVRSREFREYRAFGDRLTELESLGRVASQTISPLTRIPVEYSSTGLRSDSVGRVALRAPADEQIDTAVEDAGQATIDVEALAERIRLSEVDFEQLRRQVNAMVAERPVSIAQILEAYPAQQGLASVVGLLQLAMHFGERVEGMEPQLVRWTSPADGKHREALVTHYRFMTKLPG